MTPCFPNLAPEHSILLRRSCGVFLPQPSVSRRILYPTAVCLLSSFFSSLHRGFLSRPSPVLRTDLRKVPPCILFFSRHISPSEWCRFRQRFSFPLLIVRFLSPFLFSRADSQLHLRTFSTSLFPGVSLFVVFIWFFFFTIPLTTKQSFFDPPLDRFRTPPFPYVGSDTILFSGPVS